jgi:hypothetical protein
MYDGGGSYSVGSEYRDREAPKYSLVILLPVYSLAWLGDHNLIFR